MNQQNKSKDILRRIMQNPNAAFDEMMNSNPQFAEFVKQNKGKSAEQIARDYGIDLGAVKNLLK